MFRPRGRRPLLAGLGLCVGVMALVHFWVSINHSGCHSTQHSSRGFCLGGSPGRRQQEEEPPKTGSTEQNLMNRSEKNHPRSENVKKLEGLSDGLPPHIDDCNFCTKCHIEKFPEKKISRNIKSSDWKPSKYRRRDAEKINNKREKIEDSIVRHTDRSHLPNCTECRGCYHRLEMMTLHRRAFGRTFILRGGNSAARILVASGENVPGGQALVKLYCLPIPNEKSGIVDDCPPKKHILKSQQITNAVQRIAGDCGMSHMIPKSWVAPVKGVIDGLGLHVEATGLWIDVVEGISLNYILSELDIEEVHDLLSNHINSTEVAMVAALDVLISQCDRHDENVFFSDTGKMSIIDHDSSLGQNWRPCGIDSIFIPTTQKFQVSHLGHYYIMKQSDAPRKTPSPTLLLDYRCHVEGQRMGTDFPPPIKKCLQKLEEMSVQEAMSEYGLTKTVAASVLLDRAKGMLRNGMEWTIENGEPRNPPSINYGWEHPCCKMDIVEDVEDMEKDAFSCQSKWNPSTLLPEGDPYYS
ncbi:hypothetical protein BSKO_06054 [Bryopsis sp. KO-2023]|nr:hypothetical protein BSKO_06054 [Bryopsis sp. KO-2023]